MVKGLSVVREIRAFNREYTQLIGLMNRHILNSQYTLHELRVLYEIQAHSECTSKELRQFLEMDGGYLSRILKKLEKEDLIERKASPEDLRVFLLRLTEKGSSELGIQSHASDQQMHVLIDHLGDDEKHEMIYCMKRIVSHMKDEASSMDVLKNIQIRETLKTGDLGYITYLHAKVYQEECAYNLAFEGYVCKTFAEFAERYNSEGDRFFIAELHGQIIGCVAILEHSKSEAQLRWFLVLPEYRGIGLGKMLYERAVAYCEAQNYLNVWLLTTSDQEKAVSMYNKTGFCKVEESPVEMWGRKMIEEKYEWNR